MIAAEKKAATEREASEKIQAQTQGTVAWKLYDLYRKGGTLETEAYSHDSLGVGRVVLDRYVTGDPFGLLDYRKVRPSDVQAWFKRVPGKPRTRIRYFSVVRAAFQRWFDLEEIDGNPCVGVRMPRPEEPDVRILKDVAQAGFLAALKETPSEERLRGLEALRSKRAGKDARSGRVLDPATRRRTYEAAVLMLHGLRRAECCGLRHEAFDPEHRGVWIVRQKKSDGSVRETTKGRRERWVPLDDEACAILARRETGWVFAVGDGSRALNPRQLERDMDAQLALTPYEGIDPHDLRHSTVHSLKKAEDVRAAADILGHSPAILLGVYDRSDQEDRRRAFNRARGTECPTPRPTEREEGRS